MRSFLLLVLAFSSAAAAQIVVDRDLRRNTTEEGEYYIVFFARESPINPETGQPGFTGHAFVAFLAEDPRVTQSIQDAHGFTCSGEDTCFPFEFSALGLVVPGRSAVRLNISPGEVRRETMGPTDPPVTSRFALRVNSQTWDQARRVRADWEDGGYLVYFNDCVGYVSEVASQIGLARPRRYSNAFPKGFVDALARLNANAGRAPDPRGTGDSQPGATPDLRPQLSVSSSGTAGETITVRAWVTNRGRGPSRASEARIWLNQNSDEPRNSDVPLASIRVPALSPRERHDIRETVQLPSSLAEGTYYVWFVTDADQNAGQTSADENDDRVSKRIRVRASRSNPSDRGSSPGGNTSGGGTPDLRPSVSVASSGTAGDEVRVSYQIRNSGRGASRASTARLRISQNQDRPRPSDPLLAEVRVPALQPRERHRVQTTARLPRDLPAGSYTVWLTADATSDAGQSSTDEGNDYASDRIRVSGSSGSSGSGQNGTRGGTPDLNPRVSVPSSAAAGDRIAVSLQVRNSGRGAARASTGRVRISQSSQRPSPSDPVLTEIQVPALQPGDRHRAQETVLLPSGLSSGTYYIWLTADVGSDAGQAQSDERNDYDSDRIRVTSGSSGSTGNGDESSNSGNSSGAPDLNPRISAPSSADAGDQVRLSLRIENDGRGASRPSRARVRISESSRRPSPNDPTLVTIQVPALSRGDQHRTTETVPLPRTLSSGTYYIWLTADVDSNAGQTRSGESNDYASDRIRITAASSSGGSSSGSRGGTPDLDPRVSVPSSATAGDRIRVSVRIENDGRGRSNPSRARVRISQDSRRPSSNDPVLTTLRVPALDPGESHRTQERVELPAGLRDGTYYVWLTADVDSDAGQSSSDERNDYDSDRIRIEARSSGSDRGGSDRGSGSGGGTPDLRPSVSAPSSADAGDRIEVRVTIRNSGRGRSRPSRARVRISESSRRPSPSDPLLAEVSIPALDPGERHRVEERVRLPNGLRGGTYYVWLTADVDSNSGQSRSDEGNDYDSDRIRIK